MRRAAGGPLSSGAGAHNPTTVHTRPVRRRALRVERIAPAYRAPRKIINNYRVIMKNPAPFPSSIG